MDAIGQNRHDLVLMRVTPPVMPKYIDTTIGWRFKMKECMPCQTARIAQDFNVSRLDQDLYAARSQERTHEAREWLQRNRCDRSATKGKIVTQDEHPRPGTLLEDLARLPAPFRENGTVTAGNAMVRRR